MPALPESSSLGFPGKTPNVLNNSGKVDPAMTGGIERLVDFLRMLAERRRGTGSAGGVLSERQVLHHQVRGKAGFIAIVGRRSRDRTGYRAIGCQRPALPRRSRGDIE